MNDVKLGRLLDYTAKRDAIHVAISPEVAGATLSPGDRVGFGDGRRMYADKADSVGIVDPFLTAPVKPGERFWVFLYQNTVTSLRHEWTHPAFDEFNESEKWLRDYAVKHNSYDNDPDVAYQRLLEGLKTGELFFHGTGLHSAGDLDDAYDLQEHAEKVLGTKIDYDKFTFSCSC